MRMPLNGVWKTFLLIVVVVSPLSAQLGPASADDLVTIRGDFSGPVPGCGPWINAFPVDNVMRSGGRHDARWVVPERHKLIVTGMDWGVSTPGDPADGADTMWVNSMSDSPPAGTTILYETVARGLDAGHVPISGVVVDPGFTFCVTKSGPWNFASVFIRGYLVRERR